MLSLSLQKRFGTFFFDVTIEVENEILVLLAPSGAGKSLILNMISGIITPDSGRIMLNGVELYNSRKNISLPIRKRSIGYIFQDYALFPNKTVQENIAFGMQDNNNANTNLSQLLKRFDLEDKRNAYPHQLSGGQMQRVAIARALAAKSRIMLFDEPLSAVDVQLRESLLSEISEISKLYSLPVLYVTHNFREAEQIGDRIAIMNEGKLIEAADTGKIFRKPSQLFTAQFLGVKNIFPCRIESRSQKSWKIRILDSFSLDCSPAEGFEEVDTAWLCVHPKDVRLIVTKEDRPNMFPVYIEDMKIVDRVFRVTMQVFHPEDREKPVPNFKLYMDIEELTCRKYKLTLHEFVNISLKPDRLFLCTDTDS